MASPVAPVRALAVLPLENLSGDSGQEYFADGMTDALITSLGRISAVKVISRTSVMRYRQSRPPLADIARQLQVDALVEGAVIRAGERVRIDVRLIDAATERHLWAATYERNVVDVTGLQSDLARAVAKEIRATVTPEEQARLLPTASVDPQTYELYLKGRYFWAKRTNESVRRSIDYFQEAVRRRPDYALAHAAMAEAFVVKGDWPPQERCAKAKAAAGAALRIDDTVAEAHNALAMCRFSPDWDWAGAKQEFERALALNPNYAQAHQWYGQYQRAMGWKNWAAEVQRAGELDPLSAEIAGGSWYLESGEYDKAIAVQRKKLELHPDAPGPNGRLGQAYILKGQCTDAIHYLRRAAALSDGAPGDISRLGYAYGMCGNRVEAVKTVAQLEQLSRRRYVSPFNMAIVYAGLGQKDQAFHWLDEAVASRAYEMVFLNKTVEGPLDSLRADPRFAELKRRVGLPQ